MKFLKKYLVFFIGIGVLIMAFVIFFSAQRSIDLESANLKNWAAAPLERRMAAVQILTASEENNDLITECVDKIATLPESGEMAVRDAVSLCYTGLIMKSNI